MHTHARRSVAGLLAATLAAVAALFVPAQPAAAHNTLKAATPARDARLTTAPTRITLEFVEKLNPAFTTIAISDAAQHRIPASGPTVTGATGTVTIDEPLANGTYTVAYRVVSADGHPVQGSYRFTVADPSATAGPQAGTATTPSAPAAEPSSVSPASATGDPDRGPGAPALVGGVLLLATLVAGAVVLLRRRRTAS
ncbi:copper resistance protein CopC [Micromonospora sp. C28SCA-DRY-2]|uniref:copper resistance CopC family protein n=1 Tax=Micromonospora sp. C28SCA-DRY-2 TaxID=3059522 RepID=UPI0026772416|nr:copper resistance CopC family protein [Micromonospora sp. C28SCA-DRY-2]MDO3703114.1 copper resistance protein CopC [Micromonospora sp. C28SCA-DRY-2]